MSISINRKIFYLLPLFLIINIQLNAQLLINPATGTSPQQLVQSTLVGNGVYVSNVKYCGSYGSISFNNIGSFTTGGTPTNLGLSSGLIMSSGGVTGSVGPNSSGSSTLAVNPATPDMSDVDLAALVPGAVLHDASVLEFDFIPMSDTIKFRYVFGSDEYPEYVGSTYNDIFAFFVTGMNPTGPAYVNKNIALVPNTTTPISINNVNIGLNSQYYITNSGTSLQADGFTTVLTAWARVVPCTQYHLKLAVADRGDRAYDSWVWLEANSFTSNAVSILTNFTNPNAIPAAIEGCNSQNIKFKLPFYRTDTAWVVIDTIFGTATNGVDFPFISDSIPIYPGTLSSSITIAPFMDNLVEGNEYIIFKIKTNACGTDSIYVPIMDYTPLHITTGNDTMICQTSSAPFYNAFLHSNPTGGRGSGYYYSWYPTTDLNDPTVQNPIATPIIDINLPLPQYVKYTVTLSDTTGCPGDTSSMVITVNQQPQISFSTLPQPTLGCAPLHVIFINESDPPSQFCHWNFGDGTTDTAQGPSHNYNLPGSYNVKLVATTYGGCTDSFMVAPQVITYGKPVANFSIAPSNELPKSDATFNFNNTSTFSNTVYWVFGDPNIPNNTSTLLNPSHTYVSTTGNYPETDTVWLYVVSDYGCTDSTWKLITIVDDELIFPNIITPNADGHNDVFEITGLDRGAYPSNTFLVYNRWGKKVYEKNNYQLDSERFDGKSLADGTYFFVLKYKTKVREFEHKGTLTILR